MMNRKQPFGPKYFEHVAMVQLYRWYQLFDNDSDRERTSDQLEILDNDVIISSVLGEIRGRESFSGKPALSGKKIRANQVKSVEVEGDGEGQALVQAEALHQKLLPNGKPESSVQHCRAVLVEKSCFLPGFIRLDYTTWNLSPDKLFRKAYPVNRIKSLLHYWLLLIERLEYDGTLFDEVLAKDFQLDFGNEKLINSLDELKIWLKDTYGRVEMSFHEFENLSVKEVALNRYEVYVDFIRQYHSKDKRLYLTKTKYRWILQDDPSERFARIQWISSVKQKTIEILPL